LRLSLSLGLRRFCPTLRTALFSLLCLALAGCASTRSRKNAGNVFSELRSGDRISVRFGTIGCFHSAAYGFDFERGTATSVRVSALSRTWSAAKNAFQYHSPKPLGTLSLTQRDLSGLDRLIRFYRTHPQGACTTSDDIIIEHFRSSLGPAAPPIALEHYLDLSCAADDLPGVITFSALAQRLQSKPQ
jgi:hypothetical protein